jgi:hypothetical protein
MNNKEKINKNKVNFTLFDENFSKESVYILGLLWADGHIREENKLITINCSETDINDVTGVFKKTGEWNFSKPIKKFFNNKEVKTQKRISSTTWGLFEILKKNDYVIKSVSTPDKILNQIPQNLKKYWYRGFLDGDGCIKLGKKYGIEVVFAGPYLQDWSFMVGLCDELEIDFSIDNRLVKLGGYSHFRVNKKNHVKKLCDYIYNDFDDIGFIRKYKKYLDILKYIEVKSIKFWSEEDEKYLLENYGKTSSVECAKTLNKGLNSVYNKIRTLKKQNKI